MENSLLITYLNSPLGWIKISGTAKTIVSVVFVEKEGISDVVDGTELDKATTQLTAYFEGTRSTFDLNLTFQGTAFQKQVWEVVEGIPYGEVASYLKVAQILGDAKKTRAVGSANGLNQLLIVIPCHRVIGADGSLTGYAGGLERKKWLLDHESPHPVQLSFWEKPLVSH